MSCKVDPAAPIAGKLPDNNTWLPRIRSSVRGLPNPCRLCLHSLSPAFEVDQQGTLRMQEVKYRIRSKVDGRDARKRRDGTQSESTASPDPKILEIEARIVRSECVQGELLEEVGGSQPPFVSSRPRPLDSLTRLQITCEPDPGRST